MLETVPSLSAPPLPAYQTHRIRVATRAEDGTYSTVYRDKQLKVCTATALNPPLNPTLVDHGAGLERVVRFLTPTDISGLDIETNVVDVFTDRKIRTIQVGNKEEQFAIDLLAFCDWDEQKLIAQQGFRGSNLGTGLREVVNSLRPILESNTTLKVGANLDFEFVNLFWNLGLRPWHFYDVQIAEKNLYMGCVGFFEKGFWALDDLVARYCGLYVDKTLQTSFDLKTPLTQDQVDYSVLDVRLPLAVRIGQLPKLKESGLMRAVQIDNNAQPALSETHVNGILLDIAQFNQLLDDTRVEHRANTARLDSFFLPVVGRKGVTPEEDAARVELERVWKSEKDKEKRKANRVKHDEFKRLLSAKRKLEKNCEGEANLNYGSSKEILKCLHKMGYAVSTLKSTDDDELKKLASSKAVVDLLDANGYDYDQIPAELRHAIGDKLIDALRAFRGTEKVLSSYGEWVQKHVNPVTGRIHSRFNVLGAETNRTSSNKPNIQNILKGKDWRGCFVARTGHVMVDADWSGQELRIIAQYSLQKSWIDAFNNDWDVHSISAQEMDPERWKANELPDCAFLAFKKQCECPAHYAERNGPAKNINFGVAYGMTEFKLSNDLGITKDQARAKLAAWRRANADVAIALDMLSDHATTHFESRTLGGHRRLFKKLTWEDAAVSALLKLRKAKILDRSPTTKEIGKILKIHQGGVSREGKNTPIQGTAAEMIKLAIGCGFDQNGKPYLFHTLPLYQAEIVNEVHDEILAECPEQHKQAVKELIEDAMRRAGAEFVTVVVMKAEAKIDVKWRK